MHPLIMPLLSMMLLTLLVWCLMYWRRIGEMQRRKMNPQQLAMPEARTLLSERAQQASNNLTNLFELPVLFYALCLLDVGIGRVDPVMTALAWVFVGFRVLHSGIHCSLNHVWSRFSCYVLAALALWGMLLRLLWLAL